MKVDLRITKERVLFSLKQKRHIVAIVLLLVLCVLLWVTLSNYNTQTFVVWESATTTDCYLTPQCESLLKTAGTQLGIHKVNLLIRSPKDAQYDAAFSTSGIYATDVFLLTEQELLRYIDNDVYVDLNGTVFETKPNGYTYNGKLVGVLIAEDKYLAISANSDLQMDVLVQLSQIIYDSGKGVSA